MKNIKSTSLLSGDLAVDFDKWTESVNWNYLPDSENGYKYKACQLTNWLKVDYSCIASTSIRYHILKRYFEEAYNKCINGFSFKETDEYIIKIADDFKNKL